jgi:hypothetical protein
MANNTLSYLRGRNKGRERERERERERVIAFYKMKCFPHKTQQPNYTLNLDFFFFFSFHFRANQTGFCFVLFNTSHNCDYKTGLIFTIKWNERKHRICSHYYFFRKSIHNPFKLPAHYQCLSQTTNYVNLPL